MNLPRVILDTNILLSGLLVPQGPPAKLLLARQRGLFTLVACEELIAEFRAVAGRPFFRERLRKSAVEEMASNLADFSVFCCALPKALFAPDPKDAYLLGLAEAGRADYLVTGDKALRELKRYKGTLIVSAATMSGVLLDGSDY